ncbi:MAG TPA: hypothetical protein VMK65_11455 [Longimicrobiales bacterium]|nr:hypothetical protein [Longimicrobiales bacterium]
MNRRRSTPALTGFAAASLLLLAACGAPPDGAPPPLDLARVGQPFPASPDEPRLRSLRRLTDGGENAEAYFSGDDGRLIFQATRSGGNGCDQIYTMDLATGQERRVSTGEGKTTCGYFFPSGEAIVYSSTHHVSPACPARPDYSRGYVWPLDPYDIFVARPDGSDLRQLTHEPGYDAEATLSPDGRTIVFTSDRDGDLDIYAMDADGSNVRRLTDTPGYDGGPFFSPDGARIVYRAYHPADPAELEEFRALLRDGLVRPGQLDIWVMDADGGNQRQVTSFEGASFAPFFHPSGRRIIFSSNLHDPTGRDFDLYLVADDGTGLERVTTSPEFDGFPMFSHDGRLLAFASNRGATREGDTNVFLAEWVEDLPPGAGSAQAER